MPFPISSLSRLTGGTMIEPLKFDPRTVNPFGAILDDAMQKVGAFQGAATKSLDSFLSGEGDDLHKTIMDTQRADLAMELFLQVRNKVVQAYQEVMRMQV